MSDVADQIEKAEEAHHTGHKKVALLIAILAALLAFLDHGEKEAHTEAFQAALEANDQWSYFQSKSIKYHQIEGDATLLLSLGVGTPGQKAALSNWLTQAEQIDSEKKEIQLAAKEQMVKRDEALHALHYYEIAVAAVQIAMVMATASVITEVTLLAYGSMVIGSLAFALGTFVKFFL